MAGWIKLHRDLQNNWLWSDKPFSKGQAWIDLLMLASHKDNKFVLGNTLCEVEKGSFITSELKLMERWGWSKTKVRKFLELLVNEKMLIKKSDNKKTTLTIVKYKDYQETETTEELQKNIKKTSKELQKNTIKNVKKEKNEKNIIFNSKNSTLYLSLNDYEKLKSKYGNELTDSKIESYRIWCSDKTVNADVYKTLNSWCNKEYKEPVKNKDVVKFDLSSLINKLESEM